MAFDRVTGTGCGPEDCRRGARRQSDAAVDRSGWSDQSVNLITIAKQATSAIGSRIFCERSSIADKKYLLLEAS